MSKNYNYTLKITCFCKYVKFEAISQKLDILPTTASLKFKKYTIMPFVTWGTYDMDKIIFKKYARLIKQDLKYC